MFAHCIAFGIENKQDVKHVCFDDLKAYFEELDQNISGVQINVSKKSSCRNFIIKKTNSLKRHMGMLSTSYNVKYN